MPRFWANRGLNGETHWVSSGLGHADLRTTGRYAVVRPEHRDELVDVLDRRGVQPRYA